MEFRINHGILTEYTEPDAPVTQLVIPDGVTEIAPYACQNLLSSEDVQIPEGVIRIGAHAFCDGRHLRTVHLPDSLEEIGSYAFSGSPVGFMTIPAKVKIMDGSAFYGKIQLEEICIDKKNLYFRIVDSCIYDKRLKN